MQAVRSAAPRRTVPAARPMPEARHSHRPRESPARRGKTRARGRGPRCCARSAATAGCRGSWPLRTAPVHPDRVQRLRRAQEQAAAMAIAETQVGNRARYVDLSQQRAVRCDAVHAVAGAGPDVAVLVATDAVGVAGRYLVEIAAVAQRLTVIADAVDADAAFRTGFELHAGVADVQAFFVGRETQPVWTRDVADHHIQRAIAWVETIEVGWQLRRAFAAFVIGLDAVGRIGKPDRAVGFHHHVVGRVELLAVEPIDQHGDAAVEFGAHDRAVAVQAADQ